MKTLTKSTKAFALVLLLSLSSNMYAGNGNFNVSDIFDFIRSLFPQRTEKINEFELSLFQQDLDPETPAIPLDGELGFLLIGAAAFGVNKLRKNKKNTIVKS